MDINKLVTNVLDEIRQAATLREEDEVKSAVANWLRDKDYYVASDDTELRRLTLEETSLVEPE